MELSALFTQLGTQLLLILLYILRKRLRRCANGEVSPDGGSVGSVSSQAPGSPSAFVGEVEGALRAAAERLAGAGSADPCVQGPRRPDFSPVDGSSSHGPGQPGKHDPSALGRS